MDVTTINITFIEHILPQLISLFILAYGFLYNYSAYKNASVNHFQISNFTLGILFLIAGKVAIFIFFRDPFLIKAYVDTALIAFFMIFTLTLARGSIFNRKWHIWLQIGILPILIDLMMVTNYAGAYIFLADIYLAVLLITSRFCCKGVLVTSFLILGSINLLSSHGWISYTVYAWVEPLGQVLFVLGLKHLVDDYVE